MRVALTTPGEIKDSHPGVGVLVLSQHIETTHAIDLVDRPGFGYLLKDRVLAVLTHLRTVHDCT